MKTINPRVRVWSKFLLILFLPICLCNGDLETHDGTIRTSIIKLLVQPDAYNGKRVEFVGYYFSGQELSGVFLSREAAETRNIQLAVWVSLPTTQGTNRLIEQVGRGFVRVRGTF